MSTIVQETNGTIWIFSALLIFMVVIQALLFVRLALRFNKRHQLVSGDEIRMAAQIGATACVGPSLSSMVNVIALTALMGGAVAFMRCGVIGAPAVELMAAQYGASWGGFEIGSAGFGGPEFTYCLFVMSCFSMPYTISCFFMLKPLDMAIEKTKKKGRKISFLPYMASGGAMSIMVYCVMDYMKSLGQFIPMLTGFLCSFLIGKLAKKTGSKLLASFNLLISIIVGMTVGQIYALAMA